MGPSIPGYIGNRANKEAQCPLNNLNLSIRVSAGDLRKISLRVIVP